jgi:hypothetical protein
MSKMARFRLQVGYLEAVEVRGTVVPVPSPSEQKARAVYEKHQQQQRENSATLAAASV